MLKRFATGRAATSLLALCIVAWAGGRVGLADGEFCVVPPLGGAEHGAQSLAWGQLTEQGTARLQSTGRARAFSLPLASQATGPKPLPTVGTLNVLVLLVDFDDIPADRPNLDVRNMIFGSPADSPIGSVSQYYNENSYGKLKFTGLVLGDPHPSSEDNPDPALQVKWFRMPHAYSWYAANAFGFGPSPTNAKQLVVDALQAAESAYPLFDWSQFDQNGDGYVDMLIVMHGGPGAEGSADPTQIWSHRDKIDDFTFKPNPATPGTVKVRDFAMVSEFNNAGVLAHEMGHVLGLPDLYTNPQGLSVGLGNWSIMASGSNLPGLEAPLQYQTSRPVQFDPWCKMKLGWITPTYVTRSAKGISLPPVETNPTVLRIPANPNDPDEYFLVENRQQLPGTYDAPYPISVTDPKPGTLAAGGVPGPGVMIYHVDERRGSNDDRGHPLSVVMEADSAVKDKAGRELGFNLLLPEGHPAQNFGDPGDPFGNDRHEFTNVTKPSTINYDAKDSGVRITNIVSTANANATLDVTIAAIQGAVFTTNGGRIPNYAVQLMNASGQPMTTPTAQITGGQFTFPDLGTGDYFVYVTADGYIPQLIPVHKDVGVALSRIFLAPQPDPKKVVPGWNLITLPFDLGGKSVDDALGHSDLAVYGYDGTKYISNPPVVPGQGYWAYFTGEKPFRIDTAGVAVNPEQSKSVAIHQGWNLVGNPFPRAFPWEPSRILFQGQKGDPLTLDQAAAAHLTELSGWSYDPSTNGYRQIQRGDPVQIFEGFWYHANFDGTLIFPAPAASTTAG